MYDPLLDTFLCVADSGSFTKAAEKLYISSTALMMARRGMSSIEDQTRDILEQEHPQVRIEDITDAYAIDIFNRCERNGYILSTLDRWRDVHPGLATIPADWRPRQPYGILYPLNAPSDTLEVLQALLKAAVQIRVA